MVFSVPHSPAVQQCFCSLTSVFAILNGMQRHLLTLRILLAVIAAGAAYVFWLNTGFKLDWALSELRAASQVLIALSFVFVIVMAPKLLPARRDVVDAGLAGVVGFFIVVHSLPLVVRFMRGKLGELVVASGMSPMTLVFHHVFNMIVIPGLLWLALSSVVCRTANPKIKVNEGSYWFMIALALVGLAYISLTGTWTIV